MQVRTTPSFRRSVELLHADQKADLDRAVHYILSNPAAGHARNGDLARVRVYKFRLVSQLALLAFEPSAVHDVIVLLSVRSHETFYRDPKPDARPGGSQ